MSIHIQTATGLVEIGGKVTKEKIISALGYTPANIEDLPNIVNDNDDNFTIVDTSGNIILKVDQQGLHTTEINIDGTQIHQSLSQHVNNKNIHVTDSQKQIWNNKSDFSGDFNDLTNAPNITTDNDENLSIVDANGNLIFKVDENGLNTTHITAKSANIENINQDISDVNTSLATHAARTDIHVSNSDRAKWDNKSNFSGDYNDLTNAPNIQENENGEVVYVDEAGNIIAKIAASGLETTDISAKTVNIQGASVGDHIANTVIHISASERTNWNNKSTFSGDYNDLTNAPDIKEDGNGDLIIADKDGNIIFRSNSFGFETTTLTAKQIIINSLDVEDALNTYVLDVNYSELQFDTNEIIK